jgi:SP family general alpha glucoside:H+ symporter-like MFS transporter
MPEVVVADNSHLGEKVNATTLSDAAQADNAEHTIRLRDAFHAHKKAILWSMALSGA